MAAGNGTRMYPLTLTRPKPLLKVGDRTILEHNLDQLQKIVKEVIIVIGYRGDMIRSLIGDRYGGIKIRYVVQKEQLGTGDAAQKASEMIDDKFILMNGDDLYSGDDIRSCIKKYPSILLAQVKNPSSFGVVECQGEFVKSMVEKPENPPSGSFINAGLYFLDKSIFDFEIDKSSRGELEFTDYIRALITQERLNYIKTDRWLPVSYPWNLLEANELFLEEIKRVVNGKVDKNCLIIGQVEIEKGAIIKSGTRIEGPVCIGSGSVIGPNAFIRRGTIIGNDCRIGSGVEIKSSIIGDNSAVAHLSYIGDSVIGDNCNIGGGTITANLRFDRENVKVLVKGERIDTGRIKFGAVIGDSASVGINCSIMPGTTIAADATTDPGSVIKGDVA